MINEFMNKKYFICDNLDKYISYYLLNDLSTSDIVSEVNVGLYKDYYEDMNASDVTKDYLILVNKYNYLSNDYIPFDLEEINPIYNIGINNKLRHEARISFEKMCEDAKLENLNIYSASAFRTFESQGIIHDFYVNERGIKKADEISARAGNSEHQLGLAVDVNSITIDFEDTLEFKWLLNNSYKYGFILRYPKNKEKLTGYNYEPWHYRYVSKNVAKYIYDNDITFDEYYAFFLS